MSDTKPDPTPVLNLLNGFRSSQALFAAVELGVFEVLDASGAASPLSELCTRVANLRGQPVSEDGLDRLCRACVGLGLMHSHSPGSFGLSPLAQTYLRSSSPVSLVGYCTHSAQVSGPGVRARAEEPHRVDRDGGAGWPPGQVATPRA
jgi:hypothetical protein